MQREKKRSSISLRDFKPVEDIEILLKALAPHAIPISACKGQRFSYLSNGRPMCYLIETGSVTIHRASDGRILSTADAPFLLGTSNYIIPLDPVYISANESMKIGVISIDDLSSRLEVDNLWKAFSMMLLFTASNYLHHNLNMVRPTSYDNVRIYILELNKEPDEIKSKTNLARYIQDRTLLSRSHIMKIISELRKGGYIDVHRGMLLSVTSLPKEF
ncbi:helix-turn-helix domain-containing protein [Rahnella inusitata]|uniref:helix-turn-helix domain-containing protein n=1 Tax=Rahnella inusitata TaxID=58169 RepID=UPI001BC84448|nr:helix-turn-helix domain-containing protein [Rahnella inusitata]QUT15773.1 helix-turn-helix domain-containing protein [Rahnella inusitata]